MDSKTPWNSGSVRRAGAARHPARRVLWAFLAGALAVASAFAGYSQTPATQPPNKTPKPLLLPEANRPLDANQQMEMREKQQRKQNFEAANTERLRQLTEDSNALLTMAMALKAEVDSTSSGQLSANALRKADLIEKLARDVKEKMKLTIAPN
jgi:hypothetical protein